MSALLNWNTFVPAEREEIGMVAELCGPNGSLSLIPSNLTNSDKRVVVVLKREDGTSTAITCSSRVSEGVRAKDITVSNLFGFTVYKQINSTTGEEYPMIGMPAGQGTLITFANEGATEYQPAVINTDELVAF
ncbi:MAG TPA: hypothetical protein DCY95_00750 [Algoriphagus sp.]|jgi:hypothetical protein|nr:hypothetical protein [Algoriphagus sp.]|tara:strand:+ start:98 stop:496 length:399 start_codon:yes stop_codon:yes gene_type:complete